MYSTEKGVLYSFITGLTVISILLGLYVISIVRHQKRRISAYKRQVIRDMALIEEERKRIAADLHDDLGSMLASVRMDLENIHELLPGKSIVAKALMHLDSSLGRVKEISHNLLPLTLAVEGLGAAIGELLMELKSSRRNFSYQIEADDTEFLPSRTLIVFRVIQEILTNTIKHADAGSINIVYKKEGGKLLLQISDDGKGFQSTTLPSVKTFGLQNIQNRLELLNAIYSMQSSPGNGTTYDIKIPLTELTNKNEKENHH